MKTYKAIVREREREAHRSLKKHFDEALSWPEDEYRKLLAMQGIVPGHELFNDALKLWREHPSRR